MRSQSGAQNLLPDLNSLVHMSAAGIIMSCYSRGAVLNNNLN